MSTIGHNSGNVLTKIEAFEEACARIARGEFGSDHAAAAASLKAEDVQLRKALDTAKDAEKRPHLDANNEIEAHYKPLTARVSKAVAPVKERLSSFLLAEEARKREEAERARRAAQEAEDRRRAAEQAAKAEEDDPFATFDADQAKESAQEAQKRAADLSREAAGRTNVSGLSGERAVGLRTSYEVEVIDAAKLVAHFANSPTIIEECRKMAKAVVRGAKGVDCGIPGIKIIEERKVA